MTSAARRKEFERRLVPLHQSAFNLAAWLVADPAAAEDIVQDAYIRAWRGFDGLRGESAKAWLLTIVRNVAYRHLQNAARRKNVISLDDVLRQGEEPGRRWSEVLASDQANAETLLIEAADRTELSAALGQLPDALREAIVLREMEGLSYREIAEVMGTPLGTVMSRLSRARSELRKALDRTGKGQTGAL